MREKSILGFGDQTEEYRKKNEKLLVSILLQGIHHEIHQRQWGHVVHDNSALSLPGQGPVNNWANRVDRTLHLFQFYCTSSPVVFTH